VRCAGVDDDGRDVNTALETEQCSRKVIEMMQVRSWFWPTVAFAAELASLAALAVAGWSLPAPTAVRVLAAIGFPLVAAVLWGLFAAPRSVVGVPVLAVVTKVLVHGAAVGALLVLGHPVLAVLLAAASLLGATLSRPVSAPAAG
jgi:multidrug transporter EmrE-like cation transporter